MYTQEYVDNLQELTSRAISKLSAAQKRRLKHFRSSRGCHQCGCLIRVISKSYQNTPECAGCCKTFKGLDVVLPCRTPVEATLRNRGLIDVKRSPLTAAGQTATVANHNRRVEYIGRKNWDIPAVCHNLNTI